jgi:hypothetical protein
MVGSVRSYRLGDRRMARVRIAVAKLELGTVENFMRRAIDHELASLAYELPPDSE